MIWGRIFAPDKGNQMRRWLRFQQAMSRKRWFELDREKNGPITLFDFSTMEDAADALANENNKNDNNRNIWRTIDDSIIGGYSRAKMKLVRTREDYNRIMNDQKPISMSIREDDLNICISATGPIAGYNDVNRNSVNDYDNSIENVDNDKNSGRSNKQDSYNTEDDAFVPFVRWKGTIDTRVNKENKVQRSGFCTIMSPEFPMSGVDLGGRYNGLEIMCRSDGRPYSLNLKVESFILDDLFQCFISIPETIKNGSDICTTTGGKFDRVVLLFQHFTVTAGGRLRARQRNLDNNVKIQSIGITLMDGADGNFQFDLSRIRAVNYDETGVIGEAD